MDYLREMGIDLDGDILEEGTRLLTQLAEVVKAMHDRWPKAADLVAAAGDDVLAYMSFPQEHWTRIYSTNPLERVKKEVKRSTNVVGIFPDKPSLIRLVGSVLTPALRYKCGDLRRVAGGPALLQPHRPDAPSRKVDEQTPGFRAETGRRCRAAAVGTSSMKG